MSKFVEGATPWKTDLYYTSPWNYDESVKSLYHFSDNIKFHDVTLRDGEQQNGVMFTMEEKIALAEKMAEIGIHRIEAGMAAVSKHDEAAIREICKRNFGPEIWTFARCMKSDVDLVKDLGCDGACMEIPSNELIIRNAYKWEPQKAIENAIIATNYAHEQGLHINLFCLDSARSDWSFLTWFIDSILKDGYADSIACVDTTGALSPMGSYALVRALKERYPDKPIEFHAHDDFSCGSANTVMALAAGAEVAHTSVAGIGERAGNVSFEEVAVQLLTCYGVDTGIQYNKLYDLARFCLDTAGVSCKPNQPIYGKAISNHETGLGVGWRENLRKEGKSMLILGSYLNALTGHPDGAYCLGKHSGTPTVNYFLEKFGYQNVEKNDVIKILMEVKETGYQKHGLLTDDEFKKIADEVLGK